MSEFETHEPDVTPEPNPGLADTSKTATQEKRDRFAERLRAAEEKAAKLREQKFALDKKEAEWVLERLIGVRDVGIQSLAKARQGQSQDEVDRAKMEKIVKALLSPEVRALADGRPAVRKKSH